MIQLLRINNPVIILLSVLMSVVLHVSAMFHPFDARFVLQYSEPLSFPLFAWLESVSGSAFFYVLCLLGCAVQIVQAVFINIILNHFKIISRRNYLGGMVFVLCSSFDRQWLLFSPQQIAALLLIPIFYLVFTLSRQERFYKQLFDLGFCAVPATFFYFPSVFFLPLIFLALYSVRAFNFKEFLRIIIGLFTPVFVMLSIAYLNDNLPYLWQWIINRENLQTLTFGYFSFENIVLLILSGLWLAASLVLVSLTASSRTIQARKMIGVMGILSLFTIAAFFIPTRLSNAYWLFSAFPIAVFLSVFLSEMRSGFTANIIFALLFLSAVIPTVLL